MRPLTKREIESISGGIDDDEEGSTITVTDDPSDSSSTWSTSTDSTSTFSSSSSDSGGGDGEPVDYSAESDAEALSEAAEINSAIGQLPGVMNTSTNEYMSFIYTNSSGQVQSFGPMIGVPVGGTGQLYSFADLEAAFVAAGNDVGSIIGTVHNHPGGQFGDTDINRYPSEPDWIYAEGQIAEGADPEALTIYIVDAFGEVRGFSYSDRAMYENLTPEQKQAGANLPDSLEG